MKYKYWQLTQLYKARWIWQEGILERGVQGGLLGIFLRSYWDVQNLEMDTVEDSVSCHDSMCICFILKYVIYGNVQQVYIEVCTVPECTR